ncbi:MAG: Pycsar system effector family protein [Bacteroidota bacterium]
MTADEQRAPGAPAEDASATGDGQADPEPDVLEPADVEAVAEAAAEAVEEARAERKAKKKAKKKKAEAKQADKKDTLGTSRGVETMFRTSYRVHMDLSSLADTKANIMISINGLILPILLGAISPKIDSNPWLLVPTSVLMIGCLISMVFAIRSARPRVNSNVVTLDQVRNESVNILFFGHYANMTRDDFEQGMTELMQDNDRLYRNMIRDLYGLGSVLTTKFRLLRTSYTVFMFSIVIGVLLFIGTYFLIATDVIGQEPAETTVMVPDAAPNAAPLIPLP